MKESMNVNLFQFLFAISLGFTIVAMVLGLPVAAIVWLLLYGVAGISYPFWIMVMCASIPAWFIVAIKVRITYTLHS